jgi:hypothetical protein
VRAVSDLLPFIFPNRWYQADAAAHLADAERFAFTIMKADAAETARAAAYSVHRDEEILSIVNDTLAALVPLEEEFSERERLGLIQSGATLDIVSLSDQFTAMQSQLGASIAEGYSAVGAAAGFLNPLAVSSVSIDDGGPTIDSPAALDISQVEAIAVQRAYEVRQLDSIIDSAVADRNARYFMWLDPGNRDAHSALGPELPSFIGTGDSRIREARLAREQAIAAIHRRVSAAALQANEALEAGRQALQTQDLQDQRIERLISNLQLGIPFAMSDLTNALQLKASARMAGAHAAASYRTALSKLDRLTYAGAYSRAYDFH